MSSTERKKMWDHKQMIWVKWKTRKPVAIADVVEKAAIIEEWSGLSKAEKEQTMASVYFSLLSTKATERTSDRVGGKVVTKTRTLDKPNMNVRHVSYLVKGMTEFGCDKDEALKLWKSVEKKLKSLFEENKQEFVKLDPKPPVVEKKGKKKNRNKTIQEQMFLFVDKGNSDK